ncbi:dTDP-glucose 4,6-dehydratase [Croceifilum oryzae]|uniref:dTDP-glucose 4,6-dehydratase n=1 Tax=Croceifilum oryzae TaxID=1553429 RepID=A0AAJ1THE8_9BACL|nr:dTDP-glucose 4,6-dehydratase [Croceifilum oryzae]MDQ0418509.1 dTDP-glucose 4,6-dehydratase [Croceifilum oryzae]
MATILVTGGAGFIGSHYIQFMLENTDHTVINVDSLAYSANRFNNIDVELHPQYQFVQVDLVDPLQVAELFDRFDFTDVVHFAAESHVDRSIHLGAEPFLMTNIIGTHRLLEEVRRRGIERFIQISTDEVYGDFPYGSADEKTNLSPGNPYAASKSGADLLCMSYANTYHLPIIITRCTNNYGPKQHPEKLIPKMIQSLRAGKPITLYGDGSMQRDWIYVQDHCTGVEAVRTKGNVGEIYHIGSGKPISNLEVAKMVCDFMGASHSLIEFIDDRPGHDTRYCLDNTKISQELGWNPTMTWEDGITTTMDWYQSQTVWWSGVKY